MSKNIAFLVHGIGVHPATWATDAGEPIPALQDAAKRYSALNNLKLEDTIQWVPIRYDDIFDQILKYWAQLGKDLVAGAAEFGGAPQQAKDISAWLAAFANSSNQLLTTGGDVVLYGLFPLFRRRVLLRVMSLVADAITKAPTGTDPDLRFVVVGHSMGTSVIHDALHLLGNTDWLASVDPDKDLKGAEPNSVHDDLSRVTQGVRTGFQPGDLRFNSIFMLANVSKLLQYNIDPYTSLVAPVARPGRPAPYCTYYYNYLHALDPVPQVLPFVRPDDWAPHSYEAMLYHYDPKNLSGIHAFSHYLSHPKVHYFLLCALLPGFRRTDAELATDNQFDQLNTLAGLAQQKRDQLQKAIDAVRNSGSIRKLWDAIQSL